MRRIWKNDRGETLVETLASVLIAALSVALLFTASTVSVDMDRAARAADGEFRAALNAARTQTESPIPSSDPMKVMVKDTAGSVPVEIAVDFYGGGGALSYKLPSP